MGSPDYQFLLGILNTIADPIFVKDEEHRWVVLNDAYCEFMGYPREELLGRSDYEFFPKEQADVFWEKDEIVFRSGQTNENEESFTDSQGRVHTISTKKSLFVDSNGAKILVGIIRDMTERKELERDLIDARRTAEKADRAKSSFLANTSHELRTPMNGIIGMTDILLSTTLTKEQREAAEQIQDSSKVLLATINGLLDFSKLEAGGMVLEVTLFDLRDVVSQVLSALGPEAHRRSLNLVSSVDPEIPHALLGDPARIRDMLMNLVDNAVKFTDDGTVRVHATAGQTDESTMQVSIEVEDTGVGLSAADAERVFDAFVQVENPMTKRRGGSGLGLAIVEQLSSLMGAEVGVKSVPGEGSTFRLSIPLAIPADQPAEPLERDRKGEAPRSKLVPRILVVEDNPVNQKVTRSLLTQLGYEADTVASGEKAIEAVEARAYAAVLMDCQMPGLSGFDTSRRIRELASASRSIPIIAMSASSSAEDEHSARQSGMNDSISKPVSLDQLGAMLRRWIAS